MVYLSIFPFCRSSSTGDQEKVSSLAVVAFSVNICGGPAGGGGAGGGRAGGGGGGGGEGGTLHAVIDLNMIQMYMYEMHGLTPGTCCNIHHLALPCFHAVHGHQPVVVCSVGFQVSQHYKELLVHCIEVSGAYDCVCPVH